MNSPLPPAPPNLPCWVLGLDLSGPTNIQDTCLVTGEIQASGLILTGVETRAGDASVFSAADRLIHRGPLIVGMDAPLSYNPGGGDRPGDRRLRTVLTGAGLPSGSVMTPTMTRMAYLTLRGISLARGLEDIGVLRENILETHPGGALVLRGAPLEAVRRIKINQGAGSLLLRWLEDRGLQGAASLTDSSDHLVMACAAAFAAWQRYLGQSAWQYPADPPHHPYEYVC